MMKLAETEIEDCVRYVHAILTQQGTIELQPEIIGRLTRSYYEQAVLTPPLDSQEQGIVTLARPKAAALFADRVWSVGNPGEDPNITFGWEVPSDIRWRAMFDLTWIDLEGRGGTEEILNAPREARNTNLI